MTTVADGLFQYGGMPVAPGLPVPFTGNSWFVDPLNGSDGNSGNSPKRALQTLYQAHNKATANNNDVVYLMGNGATTATARLSLANALTIDSTATTGTLTWSKAATHLVGIAAPTSISQRARIAPPTTGTRAAIFNSGNFVVVSAQGCYFSNFDVFCGFATGGTNQIAWTDSGGRNCYNNVNFQGMGDTASAADTGSRSLLVTGSTGENTFYGCTIGLDTLVRSSGTIELEFAAGSPRNRFENCVIETWAGAAGCFWVKVGASGIDRYVLFRKCVFTNPTLPATGAGATAMTVGMSIDAVSGGAVLMPDCLAYGATKITTGGLAFTNFPASAAGGGLVTAIT
jgi:hypothetical protein